MIKVTVLAGEGKFTEFTHELTFFEVKDGHLRLTGRDYMPKVIYAPGAWLMVGYADQTDSS